MRRDGLPGAVVALSDSERPAVEDTGRKGQETAALGAGQVEFRPA